VVEEAPFKMYIVKYKSKTINLHRKWIIVAIRGYGIWFYFKHYFSFIVSLSFIGGWNPNNHTITTMNKMLKQIYNDKG
jgi:hypothetical protein